MIEVPLRLNVPFGRGEATLAFVCRLAARNGIKLARLFCQDVGIGFTSLRNGEPDAIDRLAEVAGVSIADLDAGNVVRRREGLFLGDNRLTLTFLRRQTFHVCPACLQDDIAGSMFEPDAAAYGRLIWQVIPFRTCPVHGMALVDLGSGDFSTVYDFTAVIRPSLRLLDAFSKGATLRPQSELERYVANRLRGDPVAVPFLDDIELHAAARFCEVLGASVLFGRGLRMHRLTDDDWHLAGATGMAIACAGQDGVRHALRELRRMTPYGFRARAAPETPFMKFRAWLKKASGDTAYSGLHAFVERFLAEGGDADVEFKRGRAAEGSYDLKVRLKDTDMGHEKYRFLATDGSRAGAMIMPTGNGQTGLTDRAAELAGADMPLGAAANHLRCDLALFGSMMARGIVSRSNPGNGSQAPMFVREELDRLLARMKAVATPVLKPAGDEAGIPWTADTTGVAEIDIFMLVLEGALGHVGQLVNRPGVRGLLVRPEEVRAHLEARAYPGLPWAEAAEKLRVSTEALTVLVGSGYLETGRAEVALSGYRAAMISKKSIVAFKHAFVDWKDLCIARGVLSNEGRCYPELRNAKPDIFSTAPRMTFYRRTDAPPLVRERRTIASRT
ncbi:TniQ family protein [Methylobacterium sp. J-001]|uniref:TniQ family protein n=1 Tax=Methylobacterium sp. J-001 TaxID=2836609 RepID=UPI001FBAF6C0|nr:TniQ family protein [Methylobacterium sp. J-001]MCJ2120011.1 TniQ family protein [Methylobacterium sp. J-001]